MKNTAIFDKDLNPIIEIAANEDLAILVEYISTKYSQELTCHKLYKHHNPDHLKYAGLIAKEVREMGGNSFANAVRGEGPSYHEIVCNVAKTIGVKFNKNNSITEIESGILAAILPKDLDKIDEEKKAQLINKTSNDFGLNIAGSISAAALIVLFQAGGLYSYQFTLIVANQLGHLIWGQGLGFAANLDIVRVLSIMAGPIGILGVLIWAGIKLSGPTFKVTIPCVIHIAMLRHKIRSRNTT